MRIKIIFILLLTSFFLKTPYLYGQVQQQTLKQKLELGIVKTQIFQDQKVLVSMQEPINNETQLTDFKWQLIEWPFTIKYPSSWYVREAYYGTSSLFITEQPVKEITDKYNVGMAINYYQGYFSIQKAPAVSEIGSMAQDVIYVNDWNKSKNEYKDLIKQQSDAVISIEELEFAGQLAVRTEHELNDIHVVSYYVKAGNNLMQIVFESPALEFGKYENVCNMMIESFYFTK